MSLLFEWISREGQIIFAWWLWISLAGAAVLPLCMRLLSALPDKGYTLARCIGMLLVTTIFWLLGSYGMLDNSTGSLVLSWLLVLLASLGLYHRNGARGTLRDWWRENRMLVVVSELLFIGLFFCWALYRAHHNDILGTEKPMELAFMSATQRSSSFPPADPWMSGYAISYYYLGYVMSAALSMLSGISSTIGFNLTIASQFALTGLAAFGVVYNLVRSRTFERLRGLAAQRRRNPVSPRASAIATGLLATLLMVLVGNFQMVLIEAPYQTRLASKEYLEFWGMKERANFAEGAYEQDPNAVYTLNSGEWRDNHWWWFISSRVLADYDLAGNLTGTQPIDEFPAFSFLLADNHPHVLALPFVISVIALMLNLLLLSRQPSTAEILLYGVAVGGLAFLNAWDGPIYLVGLAGAEALRRLMNNETGKLAANDWLGIFKFGITLAAIALVAYLPYLIGFRSQASGLLPNLVNPTYLPRFFIMFGPLIIPLTIYLWVESWRGYQTRRLNWRFGLSTSAILLIVLLGLMALMGAVFLLSGSGVGSFPNSFGAAEDGATLGRQLLQRRLENASTAVLLVAGIVLVLARLFPSRRLANYSGEVAIRLISYPKATGFALLLIGMGLCLTLIPEFVYLRDNFGVRINTVFKFYYQTWVVWSLAAAYGVYSMLADRGLALPHLILRMVLALLIALAVTAGLLYSVVGLHHRAWLETGRQRSYESGLYLPPAEWQDPIRQVADGEMVAPGTILFSRIGLNEAAEGDLLRANNAGIVSFQGEAVLIQQPLTLDGAEGLLQRDDQNVIYCLSDLIGRDEAVVTEATRQAYNVHYGRVGTLAGIPILLGWENHERQWRGVTYSSIAGSRSDDLRQLYTSTGINEMDAIIARYNIDYILFGSTERQEYGAFGEEKFLDHLPVVCESGESRIFYAGGRNR